jgi:Spy/CpxP family protein refolding chaperone
MRLIKLVLVAALSAAPAISFAQTTASEQPKNPLMKHEFKREFNQQQRRIGNGIRNDSLTPRQGARLERQQMRMHRQFRSMRARHNGRLTMRERRMIHRRQFVASRRIYRAKHPNRVG